MIFNELLKLSPFPNSPFPPPPFFQKKSVVVGQIAEQYVAVKVLIIERRIYISIVTQSHYLFLGVQLDHMMSVKMCDVISWS